MWGRSLKASRLLHTPKTITRVYFFALTVAHSGNKAPLMSRNHDTLDMAFNEAIYVSISSRSSSSRLTNSTPRPMPFLT